MDEAALIAQPYLEIYERLYAEANPHRAPYVPAADAATFLKRSNLNVQLLGQIWELSDRNRRGALDRKEFFIALKLVAAAQQGHPIAASTLALPSIGPPAMASRSSTPSIPNFPGMAGGMMHSPQHHQQQQHAWGISPTDQAKYDSIFDSLSPLQGKLSGAQVRPVLLNSGLNAQMLGRIWELADIDKDGNLDRVEFSVALHLVYRCLQNEPLPAVLPPSLIHPSKAMLLSRRTSTSSMSGQFTAHPMGAALSYGSRHGSIASLDGIQMQPSPVPQPTYYEQQQQMQQRPYSAQQPGSQTGSAVQTPLGPPPSIPPTAGAGEWPIDKWSAAYLEQFALCDSDSDGLVSGQDVRATLLATGLPAQDLAHVWSLVDIKQSGMLNQEQFALLMYLVEDRQKGNNLPPSLPPQLVPPSFRLTNGNAPAEGEQADQRLSSNLESAIASGNDEVKQLAEEMQKLLSDRQATEKEIVQLEADMHIKNSRIKNLQVELETLQSTVKQLERQKQEAGRRLTDFDTQIGQLEAAGQAQRTKGEETKTRIEQLKADALEGKTSEERDMKEMQEARMEISQLEGEAGRLQRAVEEEKRNFEKIVIEETKTEREDDRDAKQTKEIEEELGRIGKMSEQLQQALDQNGDLTNHLQLLGHVAKPHLFTDAPFTVASTSAGQTRATHHADPFGAAAPKGPISDPFAQTDPFASAPTSGAGFTASFPSDPFASSGSDPFAEGGGMNSSQSSANKPPPPRPAPPKSSSARQTPVTEEANTDPFGERQPAAQAAGFANFANFGAFT
ncbi:hypothetical protein WR25_05733 [Diploscapter pachys]|uniref:Uncharacterized protein n=1 Tax=Diploscapter pachys TaxID=2018661 RepID=A0A2A2LVV0_9BILA|nr:hypothetical protein WR25_05733 [Diploscapter pachys]